MLSTSAPRTPLFCIISGFATSVRLNTDNIGELSDLRQSIIAISMFIVPTTQIDAPERVMNRALARNDSFDLVNREHKTNNSFRVNFQGDTTMTLTPNSGSMINIEKSLSKISEHILFTQHL
jgi:hypothetical protein